MTEAIHYPVNPDQLRAPQSSGVVIDAKIPTDIRDSIKTVQEEVIVAIPGQAPMPLNQVMQQETPPVLNAVDLNLTTELMQLDPTPTSTPPVQGPRTEFPQQMSGVIIEGEYPTYPVCPPYVALLPGGLLAIVLGHNRRGLVSNLVNSLGRKLSVGVKKYVNKRSR